MSRPQAPPTQTRRWERGIWEDAPDWVAAEEPLQLLLDGEPLSVVMRTPGADLELALGLLYSERVITSLSDVREIHISAEAHEAEPGVRVRSDLVESNQVDVHLASGASSGRRPQRSFLSSSACGVCGATTVESLTVDFPVLAPGPEVEASLLPELPVRLSRGQRLFASTGGLHAAGLFDPIGELLVAREDVGRHNAVDKVVGRLLLDSRLPAAGRLLVVSGRAGYELAQKSIAAGIPILVAVGAPTSLAVATAAAFEMTLVGFLRNERFNVYSGSKRLLPHPKVC